MADTDSSDVVTELDPTDEAFTQSNDAMAWARAFCARLRAGTFDGVDEGLMVGWFANAMAAQERASLARLGVTTGDPNEQQIVLRAPVSDTPLNLDLVPLREPSVLVLHAAGIDRAELTYVTAALQSLVDHLKPAARAAIVLDVEGQRVETLDREALRAIGLVFADDAT